MSLGGPTTTTTQNQQQNTTQNQQQQNATLGGSTGQTSVTPNLPSWLSNYYQGMPGQQQNLLAQAGAAAGKPLYGQQQQANYQQQLNQQLGQANQNLQSSLARSGALNSARAGQAQTGLALGGAQQMGNYLANVPLQNAQFQQQSLGQLGNMLTNAMNWKPPVIGQTTNQNQLYNQLLNSLSSGTSQSDTSGTTTQQTSGGLLQSLLGGVLNAGLGLATGGLSNMLGLGQQGGGGGGGSQNDFVPYNQGNSWNTQSPGYQGGPSYFPPPSIPQAPSVNTGYNPGFGLGSLGIPGLG
ncbi:MAG: hypothetical protein KGI27_09960 [Thaumarchaeota archaeon]|nr:hypothetical protein [Nitrososphaerota archaeon]